MTLNILSYSIGMLFLGILIAIVFPALFVFLIKGWYKDAFFKPASYIIMGVLGLVLIYNCTIICGAFAMKSHVGTFEQIISDIIAENVPDSDTIADRPVSNEIIQGAIERHPILKNFIASADFTGWKISELPHAIADSIRDYLNNIILKKCLWASSLTLLAAILTIKSIGRGQSKSRLTCRPIPLSRDNGTRISGRSRRYNRR